MHFRETKIPGLFLIEPEAVLDERGLFARVWCEDEFTKVGLLTKLSQCSISFNKHAATLRGMHYQAAPHMETKIVRCTRGSIFDVALDLRTDSPTFKKWQGFILSAENHHMLYLPEGMAHGLITLEPNTEVFYQISEPYAPELARGIRFNDPAFQIEWPLEAKVISSKDLGFADFKDEFILETI